MTPRKSKRPKSDVRKVHRYGFRPKGGRNEQRAACGVIVTDLQRRHCVMSYAVPDEAFVWLPGGVQCMTCRAATHACLPSLLTYGRLCGTHEHLMAVELLVAMLQRMWQARLEVGHRCYVNLIEPAQQPYVEGANKLYAPICSCGQSSLVDLRMFGVRSMKWDCRFDGLAQVSRGDCVRVVRGDGTPDRGNWCRECLRVHGEWHKPSCVVGIVRTASNDLNIAEAYAALEAMP